MKNLIEQEDMDKRKDNSQRVRSFNMEINNTYDRNLNEKLDNCLIDFVDKYDLEESEILHYLRKFIQEVKKTK
jgi:hypothetical protein